MKFKDEIPIEVHLDGVSQRINRFGTSPGRSEGQVDVAAENCDEKPKKTASN
jgi:hypothetical protein